MKASSSSLLVWDSRLIATELQICNLGVELSVNWRGREREEVSERRREQLTEEVERLHISMTEGRGV
jgi:hypothetical protein